MPKSHFPRLDPSTHSVHHLVVFALMAALATMAAASFYPSGKPADELMSLSFASTYGWVTAQSLLLTLPGLLVGMFFFPIAPRIGRLASAGLIAFVPVVVLCDILTFNWIAERFLSSTMARITTTLLPGLILHITLSIVLQSLLVAASILMLLLTAWKLSGVIARRWRASDRSVSPHTAAGVMVAVAILISIPALRTLSGTVGEMECASARHPFCAFHVVGFRGVGVPQPRNEAAVLAKLRGLQAAEPVHRREMRQLGVNADLAALAASSRSESRPDVLLVIVECLRPDMLDPEIMPNLSAFADRSIVCPHNFSSGNATCFGMFGMVSGLESHWFHRSASDSPLLNRAFRQSGYQIGFYGGHTGWWQYDMEGFVCAEQYDDFQVEEPELPDSDLRTVQRTNRFLDRSDEAGPAAGPRMAVAYMFGTHSRYSDPEDQIFQPDAPVNSFLTRTPKTIEQFFNRFKNGFRTMDKMLAPLLRDDCVVIVVGDHGEPFFEDGTAVHGTRLSRYQSMTPAIIHYPGVIPRRIESPTFHSDLVPTLLSLLDIPLTDPDVFDGVDLISTAPDQLRQRSFITGNYMDNTSLLVGPWTLDANRPFGYRIVFDIHDWQSSYLNPIDERGYQWEGEDDCGEEFFRQWVFERFGESAWETSTSEQELFERFFASPDPRIRLAVLKIAALVSKPEAYLYQLISQSARDEDQEIRELAKKLVIEINRRAGRSDAN